VDPNRKQAVISIVAAILAARKLATVPQNSPAYVAAKLTLSPMQEEL
jgi:hypothetical protein